MSEEPVPRAPGSEGWDAGWEAHALAQRRRIASLPLWVRIDWLEETQRVVASLRRGRTEPDPR